MKSVVFKDYDGDFSDATDGSKDRFQYCNLGPLLNEMCRRH